MLILEVDSNTKLHSVNRSYAKLYANLMNENYEPQNPCLSWPLDISTEDDFIEFIAVCKQNYLDGTGITFGIFHDNELIGSIEYTNINHKTKSTEVRGWIISPFLGKGILTKCCETMIEYAFNTLNLEKIDVQVAKNDDRCRAMCERLNMKLQGIRVNANVIQGNKSDIVVYSIQSDDTN